VLSAAQADAVVDETQYRAAGLTGLDHRVYRAFAVYAFDEAICWPSQEQIAEDVVCARASTPAMDLMLAGAFDLTPGTCRSTSPRVPTHPGGAVNLSPPNAPCPSRSAA
jgi:hypothetical protein